MSKFADATVVAVQVETARADVWVEDGRSPASYPVDGVPLRDQLAMPPNMYLQETTNPIEGYGMYPIYNKLNRSTDRTSRTYGPTVMQTKYPTPVSPGDEVAFAGQYAIRSTGANARNSNGQMSPMYVRTSVWGMSSNNTEYGVVEETAVELLAYETFMQPEIGGDLAPFNVVVTLPTVSPATVPAGVSGVHLTIAIIMDRPASGSYPALREYYSGEFRLPSALPSIAWQMNLFTHSIENPLRLTVVPKTPPTPGDPAAQWETLTQEQNRLHRYTYTDITDHVNAITTEKIECDLGVTTVRLISTALPAIATAGKRVRILALHPGGAFTVLTAGTIRTRRIIEDGYRPSQLEIGVHDSHGRLASIRIGVAFDSFAEYAPVLNRAGIPIEIDGDEVTGPARAVPPWGGIEPSYRDSGLTALDALVMTRNARKGFVRLTRHDRLEVLSALPAGIAMEVSDVPGEGDASFSIDAEFGSDTNDLINQIAVQEHLMDSTDAIRSTTSDDPPIKLGYLKSRTQTAEYRRPAAIDTYGPASKSFPVVRGTGKLSDVAAGNFGPSFAGWAAAILDEYSMERSGPKSITIPVETDVQWALVSKLDVLDAIVVRFRGAAYVCRIRRVTHKISPGGLRKVLLRFDVTGDQVYWLPETLIPLGDTDAGTLADPSEGLVDGRHPNEPNVYELDGGTL